VVYRDLPQDDYKRALASYGLPNAFAHLIADAEAKAADGAFFDDGGQLSRLIGRPTTPLKQADANPG